MSQHAAEPGARDVVRITRYPRHPTIILRSVYRRSYYVYSARVDYVKRSVRQHYSSVLGAGKSGLQEGFQPRHIFQV
jgi:hypothetical protein